MADQNRDQFHVGQPKNLSCLKYWCSNFPVSTFVSWFWQAFFFVLLLLLWTAFSRDYLTTLLGTIYFTTLGLLPAVMLWQGVTQGRPERILVWMVSIGSQAIILIPMVIFARRPLQTEYFYCLAFIIAAIVSLVLVSMELVVKKEEFLKKSHEEPEGDCVIEEVVVTSPKFFHTMHGLDSDSESRISSPKTNEEEASLRCPKCGTNAGSEAYYNNVDNICYMTYCTKCVHEHGIYVRLETDEEEISQKVKDYLETKKLKKEREARKIKEKRKDFVESSLDGSDQSCANDLNPVSRVLKGRSHYEVLGVEEGCREEDIRVAFRQLARAVHPDKNRDPRAGEAFSKVQQAFSRLSKEA